MRSFQVVLVHFSPSEYGFKTAGTAPIPRKAHPLRFITRSVPAKERIINSKVCSLRAKEWILRFKKHPLARKE